MGRTLWKLSDVRVRGTGLPRLDAVTLEIGEGVTAVLGCSGAGKTSLLNLLVGFERPDAGVLATSIPSNGFALPVYWVPQDGGLWPHLTVREHLAAVAPRGRRDGLDGLLDALDIAEKRDDYPGRLSAGQRSRLALARGLAADAAVLVMDEPLAHLDESRAVRCWRAVTEQTARTGASLVFATHDPRWVIGDAQHVACLREGRLIYSGEVEDLYRRPPGREEAECLGVVNWFGPGESAVWLGDGQAERRCARPEHLEVLPAADGPLVVRSAQCRGTVAEAELVHEASGAARRVFHRPGAKALAAGQRVLLRVFVLMAVVLLAGCRRGPEAELPVREVRHWAMPPAGAVVPAPRALAVAPGGEVYAVDTAGRVLVLDAGGRLARQWEMPAHDLGTAEGACVLKDGRLAVADTHYSRVLFFTPEGGPAGEFGSYGTEPGQFIYPVGVAQDAAGDLYVAEYGGNDRVQKFSRDGRFLLAFGSFGTGREQFQRPSGLLWRDGRVYVADAINCRIQVYSDDGRFLGPLEPAAGPVELQLPYDIVLGPRGLLYVVEYRAGRVSALDPDGALVGRWGSAGSGLGRLATPWKLAVSPSGSLYVADTGNRRIVELRL